VQMSKIKVTNPYDGSLVAELSTQSEDSCFAALEAAFQSHRRLRSGPPLYERRRVLESALTILEQQSEQLALQATAEGGKPIADSRIEIARGLEGIREAVRSLCGNPAAPVQMGFTQSSANHRSHFRQEPVGPVLGIAAFNHPFNLIIHQVIPAVAAGCPVIIKPSLETPLSCLAIVKALHQAGLEEERCRTALCSNETTARLASDARANFVSFVGSSEVGWKIRSALAPGSACTLEHGGAAPVIIAPDFNFTESAESCASSLARASFYHAGQVCISAQRIFVPKHGLEDFLSEFVTATKKLPCGDPMDPQTVVGPVIRPSELTRMDQWVREAIAEGAQCLFGGHPITDSVYSPTILLNPSPHSKVSQREVFGPVVCIYSYDDLATAIESANSLPYAFHASVYTPNISTSDSLVDALDATCVLINEHPAFRVDWMPFGGRRHSGIGLGGIGQSISDMTLNKLVIQKY
jgi:acyl-CoA reductase-like NAD-dependent aldehyde dehydrogenase